MTLLHRQDSREWLIKLQTTKWNKKIIHSKFKPEEVIKILENSQIMRLRLRNSSNNMTERVQLTISTTAMTILFSKSRMMFFIIKLKQQIQTERCQGLRKLTRKTWTAISLECQTFEHLRLRIEFSQLQEIKVLTLWKITPDINSRYLNYLSRRQESHLYLVWLH